MNCYFILSKYEKYKLFFFCIGWTFIWQKRLQRLNYLWLVAWNCWYWTYVSINTNAKNIIRRKHFKMNKKKQRRIVFLSFFCGEQLDAKELATKVICTQLLAASHQQINASLNINTIPFLNFSTTLLLKVLYCRQIKLRCPTYWNYSTIFIVFKCDRRNVMQEVRRWDHSFQPNLIPMSFQFNC